MQQENLINVNNHKKEDQCNSMKTVLIILFTTLGLISCKDDLTKTKLSGPLESKSIFTETAESKFEILSKKSKNDFVYKTVESNFKPVSIEGV